jgi:hypothetical protein
MENKIKKVCSKWCTKDKKIILGVVVIFLLGLLSGWIINDNSHMRHVKNGAYQLGQIADNKNSGPEVKIGFE